MKNVYDVHVNENGHSAIVKITDNEIAEIVLEGIDKQGEYKTVLTPADAPFFDIMDALYPRQC